MFLKLTSLTGRGCHHSFDNLTEGPQILVGSSLGGWIMLNVALERPTRVAALIGIAAAPDFTEDLIWQPLDAPSRSAFKADGQIVMENPYANDPVIYPYHLIEDGRQHLRLRGPISITQPVRLLHGINDTEVPWQTAFTLTDCLQSSDVLLHFDKAATHRFSEPAQLQSIQAMLEQLIIQIQHNPAIQSYAKNQGCCIVRGGLCQPPDRREGHEKKVVISF